MGDAGITTAEKPQISEGVLNTTDLPNGAFRKKTCMKCHMMRKFQVGTPRDRRAICGNCWDWKTKV